MSFQNIIDTASGLVINKNSLVSQTIARDQTVRSVDRGGAVYRFTVEPNPGMRWSEWRAIVAEIEAKGRLSIETINLSKPAFNYITGYTGALTNPQLAALSIRYTSAQAAVNTKVFELSGLPSVSADTVIFAAGDLIQPQGTNFPYTVTQTVVRGTGATVTVLVHRTIRMTPSDTYYSVLTGQQVSWRVVCTQLPQWKIIPYDRIEWSGNFEFYESIL